MARERREREEKDMMSGGERGKGIKN